MTEENSVHSKHKTMSTPNETMSTPAAAKQDGSFPALPAESAIPSKIDRRSFLMRNAVIGAAAVMTGRVWTPEARAQQAAKEAAARSRCLRWIPPRCPPDLDVVKSPKAR